MQLTQLIRGVIVLAAIGTGVQAHAAQIRGAQANQMIGLLETAGVPGGFADPGGSWWNVDAIRCWPGSNYQCSFQLINGEILRFSGRNASTMFGIIQPYAALIENGGYCVEQIECKQPDNGTSTCKFVACGR